MGIHLFPKRTQSKHFSLSKILYYLNYGMRYIIAPNNTQYRKQNSSLRCIQNVLKSPFNTVDYDEQKIFFGGYREVFFDEIRANCRT